MSNSENSDIINESTDITDIKPKKNPHEGHRERLKERFLLAGAETMQPHELLEFLLFYAVPRSNTNVLGHDLMNHFGSLSQVFDAPYEELLKIKGISKHVASLIKAIPALAQAYSMDKQADQRVFNTPEILGEYFLSRFLSATTEIVYLMLLDSSLQYIACELISKGSVTAASIQVRTIVDLVVRYNACSVVLAHNHPRGLAIPSPEDVTVTYRIYHALKALDIRFVDHIIVAQNDYYPLIASKYVDLDR